MSEADQPINLNYNILVLDTIKNLRDSHAMGDREKYVIYSDYALQLLIPYLPNDVKRNMELDHKTLKDAIENIKNGNSSDMGKRKEILDLKYDFAVAHQATISMTLTKVGIVKVTEEGIVEFKKYDIDTLASIVRGGGGLPSKVKRITEKKDKNASG